MSILPVGVHGHLAPGHLIDFSICVLSFCSCEKCSFYHAQHRLLILFEVYNFGLSDKMKK